MVLYTAHWVAARFGTLLSARGRGDNHRDEKERKKRYSLFAFLPPDFPCGVTYELGHRTPLFFFLI